MEYTEDILYKLWLNILCGHNPMYIEKYIKKYGSAETIYSSDELYSSLLSDLPLSFRLKARRSLEPAKELIHYCNDNGISVISINDKRYPSRLAEVYAPPQILYVKGEMPDFNNLLCISIVGSRKCSDYGRQFTYDLANKLAKAGVFIISGMALGADSSAHKGALDAGSNTAAVLAGGVDIIYPNQNKHLYNKIITNGAVISERPPGVTGRASFYRERNRIIAGLSHGVVIIEGELSSGTKLTANWAVSSNRDLFAVPGKPTDKGSALPNSLIKNSAKLIVSAEDIIEEYISVYPKELKYGIDLIDENKQKENTSETSTEDIAYNFQAAPKPDFDSFDEKQQIVLKYLYEANSAVHINDISRNCSIDMTELSFTIIQLLMARVIKQHPGEYYSIS